MSHLEHWVGVSSAIATTAGAFVGETIQVDPQTIIGGGGVGVLGWLAAIMWRFLNKQGDLQDLQKKVLEAQLKAIADEIQHRNQEVLHWNKMENNDENTQSQLRNIRDELRERLPSGPHTPIQGIPLSPPGAPAGPWGRGSGDGR